MNMHLKSASFIFSGAIILGVVGAFLSSTALGAPLGVIEKTAAPKGVSAIEREIEKGAALYASPGRGGCVKCHGATGNEPITSRYPKIGGQSEVYLYNQMIDYKEKRRKNGLHMSMEIAIKPFNEKEIKSIAAYLAAQKSF